MFKVVKKMNILSRIVVLFSYFCSKHRLCVHVDEAVLTSTHTVWFGSKITKLGIPLFYILV